MVLDNPNFASDGGFALKYSRANAPVQHR
jgi:hypothetical protein